MRSTCKRLKCALILNFFLICRIGAVRQEPLNNNITEDFKEEQNPSKKRKKETKQANTLQEDNPLLNQSVRVTRSQWRRKIAEGQNTVPNSASVHSISPASRLNSASSSRASSPANSLSKQSTSSRDIGTRRSSRSSSRSVSPAIEAAKISEAAYKDSESGRVRRTSSRTSSRTASPDLILSKAQGKKNSGVGKDKPCKAAAESLESLQVNRPSSSKSSSRSTSPSSKDQDCKTLTAGQGKAPKNFVKQNIRNAQLGGKAKKNQSKSQPNKDKNNFNFQNKQDSGFEPNFVVTSFPTPLHETFGEPSVKLVNKAKNRTSAVHKGIWAARAAEQPAAAKKSSLSGTRSRKRVRSPSQTQDTTEKRKKKPTDSSVPSSNKKGTVSEAAKTGGRLSRTRTSQAQPGERRGTTGSCASSR